MYYKPRDCVFRRFLYLPQPTTYIRPSVNKNISCNFLLSWGEVRKVRLMKLFSSIFQASFNYLLWHIYSVLLLNKISFVHRQLLGCFCFLGVESKKWFQQKLPSTQIKNKYDFERSSFWLYNNTRILSYYYFQTVIWRQSFVTFLHRSLLY
jgi:hypothetical protein